MNSWLSSLQRSNRQVLVQAIGRLFCQIGYGLINFYIPILFVNQVGLSATSVGVGISFSAVTEVIGHFIGGTLADSSKFGRKTVLSLSAGLGIVVSMLLTVAQDLGMLIVASLFLGISLGFYWTASSAAVIDATDAEARHQAFAIMGVAEYVGIGLGVLGGSGLLAIVNDTPQLLFVGCGVIFLAFLILVQTTMSLAQQPTLSETSAQGLWIALKDKLLLTFVLANVFFTTYVALVTSTIPLYFTNFVAGGDAIPGVSVSSTANLFTWCYIGVGAVLQIPITQLLASMRRVRVLMLSMLLWAAGFSLLWLTGSFNAMQVVWGIVALCLLSIGSVAYKPFSVAIVSELAPESLRGVYMAVSSQCWTVGYFVGPMIGGWAMDQAPPIAHIFWLAIATTTLVCITILWVFERMTTNAATQSTPLSQP
jgi:MFS family permease